MAALPAYSEDSTKCQVPSLIDATSDELLSGLEQERFTSLDLVNVSSFPPPHHHPPTLPAYWFIRKNNLIPIRWLIMKRKREKK